MPRLYVNNGFSTLSASISAGDVTLFIQPGHGSRFPVVTGGDELDITLEDAAGNVEVVTCTAHAANATAFTVTRGQQGTTARAYAIGDLVEARLTAAALASFEADIDGLQATRSLRGGDTYAGTHDFSGASSVLLPVNTTGQTAAPGSSGQRLATLDYVNALAMDAALPGQAGKEGKFILTTGAGASWADLSATASSVTYDGSGRMQTVTDTVAGMTFVTTLTYNANGLVSTIAVDYGGRTVTYTYTYNADGTLSGYSSVETLA